MRFKAWQITTSIAFKLDQLVVVVIIVRIRTTLPFLNVRFALCCTKEPQSSLENTFHWYLSVVASMQLSDLSEGMLQELLLLADFLMYLVKQGKLILNKKPHVSKLIYLLCHYTTSIPLCLSPLVTEVWSSWYRVSSIRPLSIYTSRLNFQLLKCTIILPEIHFSTYLL